MPTPIGCLPHELIREICRLSIAPNLRHWPFGANVANWDSNETIVDVQLVCRAWRDPALRACLESVSLFNSESAQKFMTAIQANPERQSQIKYLALGVSEETYEGSEGETSARVLSESHKMVDIIALASTSLTHLHLHPMHFGARDRLLPTIRQCRNLETLVISPRFLSYEGTNWGKDAFSRSDVVEFTLPPLLHRLELDFASSWSAPTPALVPEAQPNSLRSMWLNCDTEEAALWQVLTRSESLELLHLYFERLLPIEGTVSALMTSTSTLKKFHYTTNPTLERLVDFDPTAIPIFDLVLPHYRQLSHLFVTSTEISPRAVFRLVPRSLVHLEIITLNDAGGGGGGAAAGTSRKFLVDQNVLNDLEDEELEITLKELVVRDDETAYDGDRVREFREKCERRGVRFEFCPDESATTSPG